MASWLFIILLSFIVTLTPDAKNKPPNRLLKIWLPSSVAVAWFVISIPAANFIQDNITGWPAGKTVKVKERELKIFDHPVIENRKSLYNSNFSNHKVICVFSPHPDDDVISMGGTILRLCEQGNIVHTIYQTSGSIAVWDADVQRMTHLLIYIPN